jgi:tetratricopeptide (TPR) repeat protein
MRLRVACALIAMLGVALSTPAAPRPSETPSPDDPRLKVLALLHDGRFDAADRLAETIDREGESTEEAFFRAFVTYWRLLYDPRNGKLRDEFDRRLKRTIDLAKRAKGDAGELALWKGSAHLLRAQLRATQKKIFSAGFEAKKANKWLKQAVADGSHPAESDFGLGTYEYFADRVPAIVKGLRAILTIPGGDRSQGLERLHRASRDSEYFALEARIVLATIYSDDEELMYDEATAEIDAALGRYPDVLAILHAAARIELELGRYGPALENLQQALSKAEGQPGTATSVIAALRYYTAAAELARFRPDRALVVIRPLAAAPEQVPANLTRRLDRLVGSCALLQRGAPDWVRAIDRDDVTHPFDDTDELLRLRRAARSLDLARDGLELERSGRLEEAAVELEALAAAQPDDAMLALLAGRSLLLAGREAEALTRLQAAATSDDLPQVWVGSNRLLAGVAADLANQRESALSWYGKAVRNRFYGRDAARLFTLRPCTRRDLERMHAETQPQETTESTRLED